MWNFNFIEVKSRMIYFNWPKAGFLFLVALLLICCDTIWEDRSKCSCYLSLDLAECRGKSDLLQIWYYNSEDSLVLKDTADLSNSLFYEAALPRGLIRYHVWGGIQNMEVTEESGSKTMIMQIKGREFGPLYRFDGMVNTDCEEAYDAVQLRKEYAKLGIIFKNVPDKFERALKIRILCGTSGYCTDGTFAEHSTYMESEINSNKPVEFILGRQLSTKKIKLLLFSCSEGDTEEQIGEIEIGEMLFKAGYEMKEREVKDIELTIDFSASSIKITVEDWSITKEVDIEL